MELWDVYDTDRRPTGQLWERGRAPESPDWRHLVVHLGIFDGEGRMLIQRRQTCKRAYPGLWDVTVGGCVQQGENSRQAMRRELLEELGLDVDFTEHPAAMTMNFRGGFDDVFLLLRPVELSALHLQAEEVAEVCWATRREIADMADAGLFLPYAPEFLDLMFAQLGRDDVLSH